MAHPPTPNATLSEALQYHGPLSARALCELLAAVAASLVAEHSVGLAHQNIRLTTIRLSADGTIWLSDHPGNDTARDLYDLGMVALECLERLGGIQGQSEAPPLLPRLLRAMTDPDPVRRPSILRVAQWADYLAFDASGRSLASYARRAIEELSWYTPSARCQSGVRSLSVPTSLGAP